MKRFFATVVVLFLLGIISVPPVFAATTPTPLPTAPTAREVDAGTLNELLNNSVTFSITGTEPDAKAPITIKDVNLKAGSDFKVPKLDDIANFFAAGVQFLTPYSIKQKTVDQERNLYISGKATYFKTDANNQPVTAESEQAYKTEILPELSILDQASRFAAAISSKYSISPVNGEYNYNTDREPLVIKSGPKSDEAGTGAMKEGKTVKTLTDFLTKGSAFDAFRKIFGMGGIIKAELASKQLTPYAESMDCLITGCSTNDDLSYLKSTDEQKKVKDNGGIVKTYAHISHKITTGDPNEQEQNNFGELTINTNTTGANAIKNATNYMKCAILPKSQRAKYVASGACQQEVTTTTLPDTCVGGTLPAFTANTECKLKNNSFGLAPTLISAIEAAASAYNVPASLMIAIMYGEGAFNPANQNYGAIYKNESAVTTYLAGCETLPNCSPTSDEYKNIVPWEKENWGDVASAVRIVDSTRKPNPCNLLDGIYGLAQSLHRFQYEPRFAGKSCFGIPLVSSSANIARACGDWKQENVETAIRFWELGNGWNDKTTSCATQPGTCESGGGGTFAGLQCATGGDTCDKISDRKSPKSHNGCVWDTYKSN